MSTLVANVPVCPSAIGNSPRDSVLVTETIARSKLPYLQPWDLLDRHSSTEPVLDRQIEDQLEDVRLESYTNQRNWWLLYTKARQEKKVAKQLATRGVPHFLPVVDHVSLSRGRKRTAKIPLFTGYLFLWGNDQDRIHALQTNRVCSIDKVADGEQLRSDLLTLASLIALDAPLTAEARLEIGQRVRVKSGLFAGFEGTVLKRCGKTRLFVAMEYMQMGTSMEIQDYLLDPV